MSEAARKRLRRTVFAGVIVLQLAFIARAYWAPHMEFGFQMFPEASTWQADIVRVTSDGDRVSVDQPWFGYEWNALFTTKGLASPWRRHHASAGVDNQVAFLQEGLDWLAANTPRDTETLYYEATVTTWYNLDDPTTRVLRSPERDPP